MFDIGNVIRKAATTVAEAVLPPETPAPPPPAPEPGLPPVDTGPPPHPSTAPAPVSPSPPKTPQDLRVEVQAVDPSNSAQHLADVDAILGTNEPQTQASFLDQAVPESERGALVTSQAELEQQADRSEISAYWAQHEHYVDPDTGLVYAAAYDESDGSLSLERRQQIEDGEWGRTAIEVEEDGATQTDVSTAQLLDDGGFEITSWRSRTDEEGEPVSFSQVVSTTQDLAETGATTIRTVTRFDPQAPQIETEDGPMPAVSSQTVTVSMERGPLDEPPGPAVQTVTTEFDENGAPDRQFTFLEQESEGYNGLANLRFQSALEQDLSRAADDDFDPDGPALSSNDGLAAGSARTTVAEEIVFDDDGDPVTRTQNITSTTVGEDQIHRSQRTTTWQGEPALTEQTRGELRIADTIYTFDPEGSGLRDGHPLRQIVTMNSAGTVEPDGSITGMHHDPANVRVLQEGADDDWIYDEMSVERGADGAIPEDADSDELDHEQDLDFWEEGVGGWVRRNLGLIGAALTTTGLVLQAIPIVGNAVGAGFIGVGLGVAAIDTALQAHAVINHEPGASWTNVGLAALGLIPGGRFAAVRAATGFQQTVTSGIRAGAFVAHTGATAYVGGEIVHDLATGEGVSAEDLFFVASVATGYLAANRIARRTPHQNYETTSLNDMYTGESVRPDHPVTYLGRFSRGVHEVYVEDGVLYDSAGRRLDTTDSHSVFGGSGSAIFVMNADGRIYVSAEHTIGVFHHSSFLSGQPVAAAGELRVIDGQVVGLTDRSGHYTPAARYTQQFLHHLSDYGVDLEAIRVTGYNVPSGTGADVLTPTSATGP
jgi:hypothetical protein